MDTITERIDNVTKIKPEYLCEKPPAPHSVKIELTGRCNFKCVFCAHNQRLRNVNEMDRALFENLLVEMREAGVQEIGLFYLGESFLCPWLADAIDFAKNAAHYPYVFLTTNGSLATPEKVEECMKAGLDSLKFSYNYCDEEQFKEIARVKPAYFHKMKENIKAAYEVREKGGYDTNLYASYIAYDGEQGERMAEAIEEIKPYVDELYALPLYNQAALIDMKKDSSIDAPKYVAGNQGRIGALRDPLPCWSIFTEGHIAFDGTLSACCFDHDKRFAMGDLTKENFMDAWHSDKFQELRRAHIKKDVCGTICEKCVAWT